MTDNLASMSEEISSVALQPSPEPPQAQPPEPAASFGALLDPPDSRPGSATGRQTLGAELLRAALTPLLPTRSGSASASNDGALELLSTMFKDLGAQEDQLDAQLIKALSGDTMSTKELLALQVQVYRFSLNMELLSKVVEKGTGAIKQLMNTQV